MRWACALTLAAALAAAGGPAWAEEPLRSPAARPMGLDEELPHDPPIEEAARPEDRPIPVLSYWVKPQYAEKADVEALRDELALMHAKLGQVQRSLDTYLGEMLAQMQAENARLRDELRRAYTLQPGDSGQSPVRFTRSNTPALHLPPPRSYAWARTPAPDAVDSALAAPANLALNPFAEPAPTPLGNLLAQDQTALLSDFDDAAAAPFAPLTEWGRSPEEAVRLGEDVPSLKGVIGAVPPGTSKEALVALARELRAQFEGYDNINVEVFDSEQAAAQYAERNTAPKGARVLSISKHARTGRDAILLIDGEDVTELPWRP